jgi:hypothetical protein
LMALERLIQGTEDSEPRLRREAVNRKRLASRRNGPEILLAGVHHLIHRQNFSDTLWTGNLNEEGRPEGAATDSCLSIWPVGRGS